MQAHNAGAVADSQASQVGTVELQRVLDQAADHAGSAMLPQVVFDGNAISDAVSVRQPLASQASSVSAYWPGHCRGAFGSEGGLGVFCDRAMFTGTVLQP